MLGEHWHFRYQQNDLQGIRNSRGTVQEVLAPIQSQNSAHASRSNDTKSRIGGTVASSIYLMMQGVQILRIHDVNELLQGIKVFKKLFKN